MIYVVLPYPKMVILHITKSWMLSGWRWRSNLNCGLSFYPINWFAFVIEFWVFATLITMVAANTCAIINYILIPTLRNSLRVGISIAIVSKTKEEAYRQYVNYWTAGVQVQSYYLILLCKFIKILLLVLHIKLIHLIF